jgi:hypothetical protein
MNPAHEALSPLVHLRLRDRLDDATEKLALRAAAAARLRGLTMGRFPRDPRATNEPLG